MREAAKEGGSRVGWVGWGGWVPAGRVDASQLLQGGGRGPSEGSSRVGGWGPAAWVP